MQKNKYAVDFLTVADLTRIELEAQWALTSYELFPPEGYQLVKISQLGIPGHRIPGRFTDGDYYFRNGDAEACVLRKGDDYVLSFRGTDWVGDAIDYPAIGRGYIKYFDLLLSTLAVTKMDHLSVTGHSLGAAAVHELAGDHGQYGRNFNRADYMSFSSPSWDNSDKVMSFGYANDKVYGLLEVNKQPPYVDNFYWYTEGHGLGRSVTNFEAHAPQNQIDGINRVLHSEILDPQNGFVERRGLDLNMPVIINGSNFGADIPENKFNGTVVMLGIDTPIYNHTDTSTGDYMYGRDRNRVSDWLDGMSGDDVMYGYKGPDVLFGDRGFDDLHGGDGRDILNGGAGDDTLDGGKGADDMNGGYGWDTFIFDNPGDRVTDDPKEAADDPGARDEGIVKSPGKFLYGDVIEHWNIQLEGSGQVEVNVTSKLSVHQFYLDNDGNNVTMDLDSSASEVRSSTRVNVYFGKGVDVIKFHTVSNEVTHAEWFISTDSGALPEYMSLGEDDKFDLTDYQVEGVLDGSVIVNGMNGYYLVAANTDLLYQNGTDTYSKAHYYVCTLVDFAQDDNEIEPQRVIEFEATLNTNHFIL